MAPMALPEESTGEQASHNQEMDTRGFNPRTCSIKNTNLQNCDKDRDIKVTEQHEWLHVQILKVQWDSYSGVRGESIWEVK